MKIYVGDKVIFRDCFGRKGEGEVSSVFGHICEVDTGNGRKILVAVNDILKADGWREKKKMKCMYPAVFTHEEDGKYSINFPDLEGCYTCGDNLEDGIKMASDVLYTVLREYEKSDKDIPIPTDPRDLCGFLVYCIEIDTDDESHSIYVLAHREGEL